MFTSSYRVLGPIDFFADQAMSSIGFNDIAAFTFMSVAKGWAKSETAGYVVQKDKVFTEMMMISLRLLFWTKKLSVDDFLMTTWVRENKSERKKESEIPCFWNSSLEQ